MNTQTAELISIAKSLPLDERAEIVDSLLESMHPTDDEIDNLWKAEVERRLDSYDQGVGEMIPGDAVFQKINQRFAK